MKTAALIFSLILLASCATVPGESKIERFVPAPEAEIKSSLAAAAKSAGYSLQADGWWQRVAAMKGDPITGLIPTSEPGLVFLFTAEIRPASKGCLLTVEPLVRIYQPLVSKPYEKKPGTGHIAYREIAAIVASAEAHAQFEAASK